MAEKLGVLFPGKTGKILPRIAQTGCDTQLNLCKVGAKVGTMREV